MNLFKKVKAILFYKNDFAENTKIIFSRIEEIKSQSVGEKKPLEKWEADELLKNSQELEKQGIEYKKIIVDNFLSLVYKLLTAFGLFFLLQSLTLKEVILKYFVVIFGFGHCIYSYIKLAVAGQRISVAQDMIINANILRKNRLCYVSLFKKGTKNNNGLTEFYSSITKLDSSTIKVVFFVFVGALVLSVLQDTTTLFNFEAETLNQILEGIIKKEKP